MPYWDETKHGWVVTRYDEAAGVLRDATAFTVDDPRFSTARVVGPSMLSTDGASHTRQRRAFQPLFTRRQAIDAEGVVALIIARRLEMVPSEGEWRTLFAAPVAAEVMIELFSLPLTADVLLDWYRTIVDAVSAAGDSSAGAAYGVLSEAILGGTVVVDLLAGDSSITSLEAASNTAVALFGGIETVEGTIASAIYRAFESTTIRDALLADSELLEPFIEEVLRFDPAAAVVHRYATEAVALGEAEIAAGDFVEVSLRDANRDPEVFEKPDEFKLGRANGRAHLSFAVGPHVCLGLHLARLEARVAIEQVLARAGTRTLDTERSLAPAGDIFQKPTAVHLKTNGWGSDPQPFA